MEKLKKLFPLSFKYCGNVKQIILGMFIYVLLDLAVALVVSTVLSFLTTPLIFLMFICVIPYIGWLLAIFILPVALLLLTVLSYAELIITGMASIYITAGIVTMFVAYAKTPEVESVKKADKAAAPAEETYAEVNEEA